MNHRDQLETKAAAPFEEAQVAATLSADRSVMPEDSRRLNRRVQEAAERGEREQGGGILARE